MPIYQYRCNQCRNIEEVFYSITGNIPVTKTCSKCKGISVKIISAPNINVGVRSRVYFQYKGNPADCPDNLREALEKQDMPKGISGFQKEGEPVLGTGEKFKGKERIE